MAKRKGSLYIPDNRLPWGDQNQYDPAPEYALMQRAGLNWSEILASLTIAPAQKLDESQGQRT